MANNLGSLRVSLGLDAAEFTAGLTKAEYQARKFGEELGGGIRSAAMLAAGALAAVGVSAAGAVAGFNALINGAGDFQDLAEKTGASAEALASFGVAAGTAGTTVATIADASNKLTKNLAGVDDESKAAGAAIAALGLNLKDFKALAPEARIEALSKSLAGFEDGPNKAAVAMALLGKSGAELLPFLKTLEEQGGRQVILTQQQIDQADEYADRQAKARAELLQYAQALATQALPSITAFTGALTDTAKEMLGVGQGASNLKNNTGVADFADGAVRALGFIVDAGDGVVRVFSAIGKTVGAAAAQVTAVAGGEFKQALNIGKEWQQDMANIANAELFSTKLSRRLAAARSDAGAAGPASPRKTLNFDGAEKSASNSAGEAAAKKMLDNQLKAYENAIKEEDELLSARNHMLDLYNSENMIATREYFASKQAALDQATTAAVAAYDKEIAALEAYKASVNKPADVESAQGKINDLYEKRESRIRAAERASLDLGFAESKAAQALISQMSSVNAEIMELTGNLSAASKIRLDDQYKDLIGRLTANGDTAGVEQVNRLKSLKTARIEYNAEQEKTAQILGFLQVQEDRIAIAQQLGADTEFGSMLKLGEARRATLMQLESVVLAQEAIAKASGNPALILQAEQARVAWEKLAATVDPLANKLNSAIDEAAGQAFADYISGAKSAKDAVNDFGKSVFNEINGLVSKQLGKQLMESLFGDVSKGGGAGGFLSQLFGTSGATAGGGTGGLFSGLGGFFSNLFGFAGGGIASAGSMHRVNENGPEMLDYQGKQFLMMGAGGGKITSNRAMGSASSPVINITVPGNVDRRTAEQVAAKVSSAMTRAMARGTA